LLWDAAHWNETRQSEVRHQQMFVNRQELQKEKKEKGFKMPLAFTSIRITPPVFTLRLLSRCDRQKQKKTRLKAMVLWSSLIHNPGWPLAIVVLEKRGERDYHIDRQVVLLRHPTERGDTTTKVSKCHGNRNSINQGSNFVICLRPRLSSIYWGIWGESSQYLYEVYSRLFRDPLDSLPL
jgi:hypothetical protein